MNPKVVIKKDNPNESGYQWVFTTLLGDVKFSSGIINNIVYSMTGFTGLDREKVKLLSYHYTLLDKFLVAQEILFRSKAIYTLEETKAFIKQGFQYEYPTDVEFEGL